MNYKKMNSKGIVFFLFVLISSATSSQKIELYSGALKNHFYDSNKEDPHNASSYKGNWGYSLGFAIDSLKFEWHTLRVAVQYDNYSGRMFARSGGLGGSYAIDGQINKHIVALSIYPINIRKLLQHMQLSIGFTGSFLLKETFSGEYSGWNINEGTYSGSLNDKYSSYSTDFTFGVQSLINYSFRISESFEIVPQYSFYLGLSKELINRPTDMKSIRHYFVIGIRKSIKN